MKMARTHQAKMNGLNPAGMVAERVRRISDCVDSLLELPLKDREFVISFVTELQRNIDIALLKNRFGKGRVKLEEFLAVLGDDEGDGEPD